MIRAVVLFVQITLLVFAGVWLANEPGTVMIVWRDWRIDPPIGLVVVLIVVVALAVALAYRGWRFLVRAPGRIVASHRIGKERRGYRALADGMVALAAGDSSAALRQARRAASLLDQPAASHLLLAQAAELEGNRSSAQSHFEAMLKDPETEFVGFQGLMRQMLERGDSAKALNYARRAVALRPGATWLLPQLFKLLVAAEEWVDADNVAAQATKSRAVPSDQGNRWRAAILAHRGSLAVAEGDQVAAIGFMREAIDLDNELVPAGIAYSRLLEAEGKTRRATRVLEQMWGRRPHPKVAEAYVKLVGGDDSLQRVKAGQRLVTFNPDHPNGQLLLAELSLRARLWGEARKHLENLLRSHPTAVAFQLMADLERNEGGDAEIVNGWLSAMASAPAGEGWLCSGCGVTVDEWVAVCGNCAAIASFEWQMPPHVRPARSIAVSEVLALPGATGEDARQRS